MKYVLVIIFYLMGFSSYGQYSNVTYIIPDAAEIAIKKKVDQIKKSSPKEVIYFLLEKDDTGLYTLSLFHDNKPKKDDHLGRILNTGNRVLLIDTEKYPLLFDYDLTFGTPNEREIGKFGDREGNIVRSTILHHGYSITFDKRGRVVNTSEY